MNIKSSLLIKEHETKISADQRGDSHCIVFTYLTLIRYSMLFAFGLICSYNSFVSLKSLIIGTVAVISYNGPYHSDACLICDFL